MILFLQALNFFSTKTKKNWRRLIFFSWRRPGKKVRRRKCRTSATLTTTDFFGENGGDAKRWNIVDSCVDVEVIVAVADVPASSPSYLIHHPLNSHSPSFSLPLYLSLSFSLSLVLSPPFSLFFCLPLSPYFSVSLFLPISLSPSFSLPRSISLVLFHSFSLFLSLPLSLSFFLPLSPSLAQTHLF